MLAECVASVQAQTVPVDEHHVALDSALSGDNGGLCNLMLEETDCEWIQLLADDDLLLPHHVETLAPYLDGSADIVYGWCEVTGRPWNPNRPFDADALRVANYIPATALIRRELAVDLGGWGGEEYEDWHFWLRALDAGAEFCCVPEVTWVYRFHGANRSWQG
jgi:hypothetical protein